MVKYGISPTEFWNLTPFETQWIVNAYEDREKFRHHQQSWFCGHILSVLVNSRRAKNSPVYSTQRCIEDLNSPFDGQRHAFEVKPGDTLESINARIDRLKSDGSDTDTVSSPADV